MLKAAQMSAIIVANVIASPEKLPFPSSAMHCHQIFMFVDMASKFANLSS